MRRWDNRDPRSFSKPCVVLCEGESDEQFINLLAREAGLAEIEGFCVGGKDNLARILSVCNKAIRRLKAILFAFDADENPHDGFRKISRSAAGLGLEIPAPFEILPSRPRTGVFLFPGRGQTGTLEHLLLSASLKEHPEWRSCLDGLSTCLNAKSVVKPNDLPKAQLHALVAMNCYEEPATSLSHVWSKAGNPIPTKSPMYDELVEMLCQLEA